YQSIGANEGTTADTDGVITPLADDGSETLQIDPQEFTVRADLDKIGAPQTADAINDNAVLVWLAADADATTFEILTLKEIRLDAGVYKLKVRRGRFNTPVASWITGATCWIGYRSDLVAYTHEK